MPIKSGNIRFRSSAIYKRGIGIMFTDISAIFCFFTILYLSLRPIPETLNFSPNDKFNHVLAYTTLSCLICIGRRNIFQILCLFLATVIFGGSVEIIQPYIGRYGEWQDFYANTVGSFIGTSLALLFYYQFKK